MSLIQRNAAPLFILLAVVAVGAGVLLSRSPFAFGEEPVGCNVSTVGISILTTGEDGSSIGETNHGDTISYQVILSIPELPAGDVACNYGGGSLSVVLPNGNERVVAGSGGGGAIPTIQVGSPFSADPIEYVVDQGDATDMELTARANYSGGFSFSVPEGEAPPEASSSISNTVRITPPSITLDIKPDTTPATPQVVYLGESAVFGVTVTNTGGFALSNVTVSASRAPDCERVFPTLAVGASESYQCSLRPGNNVVNDATVTGQVVGGVSTDQSVVTASDSSDVRVESVAISIDIEPEIQRVRLGNEVLFNIVVGIPGTTGLDNVAVVVPRAPDCDRTFGSLEAAAQESYSCTVSADPDADVHLDQGSHTVVATATGQVPGLAPLTANDDASVEVFALDLFISIEPEEQTIAAGDSAEFTVTVGNFGDTVLSNVVISNDMISECNGAFSELLAGSEETYECASGALVEYTVNTATATATAPDGGPVSASDSASVVILRPSTALSLEEVSTTVLRFVVQTLKVTETNDGDSPLTNICVQLDTTGSTLPITEDAMSSEAGEGMGGEDEGTEGEGESMDGEGMMMPDHHCTPSYDGVIVLTKDSLEYVGGDFANEDGEYGIMEVGETWEWRVVTVGVAGSYVPMGDDALNMKFVAIGHGTDALGGDVTFPGDTEELGEIEVPIVTR